MVYLVFSRLHLLDEPYLQILPFRYQEQVAVVLHTSYFLIKDAVSADHAMISAWLGAGMFKRTKIMIESGALFLSEYSS